MGVPDPIGVESLPLVSLTVLKLQPGDVVVLTSPDKLSERQMAHLLGVLNAVFPDNESILLDNGIDLSVLRPESVSRPKVRPFPHRKAS